MARVECLGICKSFKRSSHSKSKVAVLDNFSLTIQSSQFVSIIGPNGCGKTTLLFIISRLLKPDSGVVTIDSGKLNRCEIGFVFQDYRATLLPWRRNIDNVAFPFEIKGWSQKDRRERVVAFLSELEVDLPLERFPYELSGGEQQKLVISRALIPDPDVLILDETFSALDCTTRMHMQQKLQDIWMRKPLTTIFVTHDVDEGIFLADRLVILSPKPASVIGDIEVKLPRPRNIGVRASDDFAALRAKVIKLIGGKQII